MTFEEELHTPPKDPELYEPVTEHLPDSALHQNRPFEERSFAPFPPVVLETNSDGTPKKGLCGRDIHGVATLPEGVVSRNVLKPVTTGEDLHHPEYQQTMNILLKEGHGASWYLFEPPTDVNEHDRATWSENS